MYEKRKGLAPLLLALGLINLVLFVSTYFYYFYIFYFKASGKDKFDKQDIKCIYSAIYINNISFDKTKNCTLLNIRNVGYENVTGIIVEVFQNKKLLFRENFENFTISVNKSRDLCIPLLNSPINITIALTIISCTSPPLSYTYEVGKI